MKKLILMFLGGALLGGALFVGQTATAWADGFADGRLAYPNGLYVAGTIGYAWNYKITATDFDDTFCTLAYPFMAAASLAVADSVSVLGGYRTRLFTETSEDNSLLVFREHEVHGVEVGLRLDF